MQAFWADCSVLLGSCVYYEGDAGVLCVLVLESDQRTHSRGVHCGDFGGEYSRVCYCQFDKVGIGEVYECTDEGWVEREI